MSEVWSDVLGFMPKKRKYQVSGWINYNCPVCTMNGEPSDDKNGRGAFIHTHEDGFVISCFRCKFKTGWEPGYPMPDKLKTYLRALNVSEEDIRLLSWKIFKTKRKNDTENPAKHKEFFPRYQAVDLPGNAKSFSYWLEKDNPPTEFLEVLQYVVETRGTDVLLSNEYYWSTQKKYQLNKRVILPCYWNNKIVGWLGRHIGKHKLRYMHDIPKNYIYNNHVMDIKTRKFVLLVEGPFDANAVDGCSPLGGSLSQSQIDWINRSGKEVILIPDFKRDGRPLVEQAITQGWYVSFPPWARDIKDCSEAALKFGRLWTIHSCIDSRVSDEVVIRTKMNIFMS